jgi:antitoxin YefM
MPRSLVILVTMATVSLADAKAHLSKLVAQVSRQHERVYVTVHGKPSAVLLATEDLESLEETIEILADADAMRRLHASEAELARGEVERRELNADMGPPTQPTAVSEDQLDEPHRVGRQLRPPLGDRHSARRGTYRVVYRVDGETRTVTVLDVGSPPRRLPGWRPMMHVAFAVGVPWLAITTGMSATQPLKEGRYLFIVGGRFKAAVASVVLGASACRNTPAALDGRGPQSRGSSSREGRAGHVPWSGVPATALSPDRSGAEGDVPRWWK